MLFIFNVFINEKRYLYIFSLELYHGPGKKEFLIAKLQHLEQTSKAVVYKGNIIILMFINIHWAYNEQLFCLNTGISSTIHSCQVTLRSLALQSWIFYPVGQTIETILQRDSKSIAIGSIINTWKVSGIPYQVLSAIHPINDVERQY